MRGEDEGEADDAPVVWFSIFDWWTHSHGHSDFELATRLARRRRVLFVNSLGMRAPIPGRTSGAARRVLRKIRSATRGLRRPRPDLPNLSVLTPASLPIYGGAAARLLSAFVAAQVRLAMRRAGIADPVLVVTAPSAYPAARRLSAGPIVYNRSDAHGTFAEAGDEIRRLETRMLRECPLVVYAAAHLLEQERPIVGERGLHIEHGVERARFRPEVEPDPEISALPRPRYGYCGALRRYAVDVPLLETVADRLGPGVLVLVGERADDVSALLSRPNVRWFPPRPHEEMPGCWAALDVGLAPYRDNAWLRASEPIKLREMLVMGVPVVSTPIPAARRLAGVVRLASGAGDFVAAMRQAAVEGPLAPPPPVRDWDEQAERLGARLAALAATGLAVGAARR